MSRRRLTGVGKTVGTTRGTITEMGPRSSSPVECFQKVYSFNPSYNSFSTRYTFLHELVFILHLTDIMTQLSKFCLIDLYPDTQTNTMFGVNVGLFITNLENVQRSNQYRKVVYFSYHKVIFCMFSLRFGKCREGVFKAVLWEQGFRSNSGFTEAYNQS